MNGRKSFAPTDIELSEAGEVAVAFARFDVIDHDKDVIRKQSIPVGTTVAMSNFGHSSWDAALPIGKGVLGVTDELATFNGSFFLNTDQGRNGYETVKAMGSTQEWSFGFSITDSSPITFNGTTVREIRGLDIFEVSPVLKGAGIQTSTLAIKSDTPETGESYAEQLARYVAELSALLERTKDRKAFRESEGRDLSRENLEQLRKLLSDLQAHADAIKALLPAPVDDRAKRALMVEIERARALGVPI